MQFTDIHKLNKTAYDALKRIRGNKSKQLDLIAESSNLVARNKFNLVFQEFDESKFNEKIKLDTVIYNKLFENVDSVSKESVSQLISEMVTTVRDIYKFINIEPKLLGFKNIDSGESQTVLVNEASNIINNYFNREYYSLSRSEKDHKYKESVINLARTIVVEESVDPKDALTHSYKAVVVENLIHSVNFPYIIKHKINEVFEDNLYNDFFDVDELSKLMESFNDKVKKLARIASVVIE